VAHGKLFDDDAMSCLRVINGAIFLIFSRERW